MSASTQAKPRGGRVGVQPLYVSGTEEPVIYFKKTGDMKPWGVRVTGVPLNKLKRLVEIAGMDEAALIACIQGPTMTVSTRHAMLIIKTLGLSSARGGRK